MKKLAIVVDSFCGETEKFFKDNYQNVFFLPLQIFVNEKQYIEGTENIPSIEEIKNKNNDVKTSLPVSQTIENVAQTIINEYENVVCLFINSKLSSTFSIFSAKLESMKKENKKSKLAVLAFDNHFVGKQYVEIIDNIFKIEQDNLNKNDLMKKINNFLENENKNSLGFIIPSELSSFAKHGRLTGIKKFISSKFFLLIKIFNGVRVSGISRTFNGAIKKVLNKIYKFIEETKGSSLGIENFKLTIVYAWDEEKLKELENLLKELGIKIDVILKASLSTTIHTGYGAVFIGISPKNNN